MPDSDSDVEIVTSDSHVGLGLGSGVMSDKTPDPHKDLVSADAQLLRIAKSPNVVFESLGLYAPMSYDEAVGHVGDSTTTTIRPVVSKALFTCEA